MCCKFCRERGDAGDHFPSTYCWPLPARHPAHTQAARRHRWGIYQCPQLAAGSQCSHPKPLECTCEERPQSLHHLERGAAGPPHLQTLVLLDPSLLERERVRREVKMRTVHLCGVCLLQMHVQLIYQLFCQWSLVHMFLRSQLRERLDCSQSGARSSEAAAAHPVKKGGVFTSASATINTQILDFSQWLVVPASVKPKKMHRQFCKRAPQPSVLSLSPWSTFRITTTWQDALILSFICARIQFCDSRAEWKVFLAPLLQKC